jgi:hypothetical protein
MRIFFLVMLQLLSSLRAQEPASAAPAKPPAPAKIPLFDHGSQLSQEEKDLRQEMTVYALASGALLTAMSYPLRDRGTRRRYARSHNRVVNTLNEINNTMVQKEALHNGVASGEFTEADCETQIAQLSDKLVKLRNSKIFQRHEKIVSRMKRRGYTSTDEIHEIYSASKPLSFIATNVGKNAKLFKGSLTGRFLSSVTATAGILILIVEGQAIALSYTIDQHMDNAKMVDEIRNLTGLMAKAETWKKVGDELQKAFAQQKQVDSAPSGDKAPASEEESLFEIDDAFLKPER